ncbi:hypothetical protein Tco_1057494 [Tanacetum coccineum]|uniref:Uncharacterized protein n=1 Tax=Tanacetum coccineum TaxID=301880 RepID=A0ABQ5H7B4_9ASTR
MIINSPCLTDKKELAILGQTATGGSPRRQDTMRGAPAQTRMEQNFELTANVLITPHDLPLLGGYTPKSDEGRLKLQELMTMCTKLSKHVLDLERQRKSSTSQPRRRKYRQVKSLDDDLNKQDASKQGRRNDKTEQ